MQGTNLKLFLTFAFAISLLACTNKSGSEDKKDEKNEITIISPSEEMVCLANYEVEEFVNNYTKGSGRNYAKGLDHYYMKGLVVEWDSTLTDANYKLNISMNEDFSDSVTYETESTSLLIDDLYVNQEYYVQIEANDIKSDVLSFTTSNTPRTIEIGGVSNTRDIGGKYNADGKLIKQGLIYRSANFDNVNGMGRKTALEKYGIKTELDLRYSHEGYSLPTEGLVGTDVLGTGKYHIVTDGVGIMGGAMYIGANQYLSIDKDVGKECLRQELAVFGDKNNYPIDFHCKIGRDRTGCLSLILLSLLNATERDIYIDYEMSAFSQAGSSDGSNYMSLVNNNLTPTYQYIRSFPGRSLSEKCANFLLDAGVPQSTINTIKEVML